jgi:hypothetical protein
MDQLESDCGVPSTPVASSARDLGRGQRHYRANELAAREERDDCASKDRWNTIASE